MEFMVVPDVHGRIFWKEAKEYKGDKIVFLGDYIDPYESVSREDLIANFKEIIGFAKENPDKVVLLLGNHDVHYIDSRFACSRYDIRIASAFLELYNENKDLFRFAYYDDNILFTHAGVTDQWIDKNGIGHSNIQELANEINKQSIPVLMQCSSYRGGLDQYSGPLWCDIDEHDNKPESRLRNTWLDEDDIDPKDSDNLYILTHPKDIIQVVGHTQQVETGVNYFTKDNSVICVDNRKTHIINSK